jgi:hypothetical protein
MVQWWCFKSSCHVDINILVNCNWDATRCQQYSTHLHTNSTQNYTINLGRVRAVSRLCELYPDIFLTTEDKARINLSQGSGLMAVSNYTEDRRRRILRPNCVESNDRGQ